MLSLLLLLSAFSCGRFFALLAAAAALAVRMTAARSAVAEGRPVVIARRALRLFRDGQRALRRGNLLLRFRWKDELWRFYEELS